MGAIDDSVIVASILKDRYKTQFRRSLPSDCHRYLRAETRGIPLERGNGIHNRPPLRDNHVHQEPPAIRGRRNLVCEQTADVFGCTSAFERQVQGSLDLPTKLSGLPFCLSFR
jgi:hypothetical protein